MSSTVPLIDSVPVHFISNYMSKELDLLFDSSTLWREIKEVHYQAGLSYKFVQFEIVRH